MTHPLVHALVEIGSEPPKPSTPEAPTTEAVVKSLLTENTGRHMLDSGGAYGRSWERNQGRDFAAEPEVTASWKHGYIDVTLSLYHFLVNTLEYLPELDEKFEEWCKTGEMKHEGWFVCIEEFIEQLQQQSDSDPDEPFDAFLAKARCNPYTGDDVHSGSRWTTNTYNHDSLLSQVIQYSMVGNIVFLQVHGGCDVRGGYTQPRVFEVFEDWPCFLDDQHATIFCDDQQCNGGHSTHWQTDDGYHWYFDGSTADTQLEEYEAVDIDEDEGFARWRARIIVRQVLGEDPLAKQFPPLRAYGDDFSICPLCQRGRLSANY